MKTASDPHCQSDGRRQEVRARATATRPWNGIDYVEVGEDHRSLRIYFLNRAPIGFTPEHFRVVGGQRVTGIRVVGIDVCASRHPDLDDCLTLTLDRSGDASAYVVEVVDPGIDPARPPRGFDLRYARATFYFTAGCGSDSDCLPAEPCASDPPAAPLPPSYLAKDYASFRRLILDRLSLTMPEWKERHVPDVGVALVEILAYVGDHLSYYQDAIATEAYLHTARQRISVRRHLRLVDYLMHDGHNARALVCLETDTPQALPARTLSFLTGRNAGLPAGETVLTSASLLELPREGYEVFEPVGDADVVVTPAHNLIRIYTWGDSQCCLPRGATGCSLRDEWLPAPPPPPAPDEPCGDDEATPRARKPPEAPPRRRALDGLQKGDFLIFEEVLGPATGNPADADPTHRHAVRIDALERRVDELLDVPVVEISWDREDALPFQLCVSVLGPPAACLVLEDVTVVRGNVVLVDHGRTLGRLPTSQPRECLGEPRLRPPELCCDGPERPGDGLATVERFRPRLSWGPLVFSSGWDGAGSARAALTQDVRRALPQISLSSRPPQALAPGWPRLQWELRPDLLGSGPNDLHYVVEVDDDGVGRLRFGDGELGRPPIPGHVYRADYRVGRARAGQVGADAITHLHSTELIEGVRLRPRNPLPATEPRDPQPLAEAKLLAPLRVHRELERAIVTDDYVAIAERTVELQKASARLSYTGSWYEVQVALDPRTDSAPSAWLVATLDSALARYRRMGHDVRVSMAATVGIALGMRICVARGFSEGRVRDLLVRRFSAHTFDGRPGFFHPDRLTFGQAVTVSAIVLAAHEVPGVASVALTQLRRAQQPAHLDEEGNVTVDEAIREGRLVIAPHEIARLDNDPRALENGVLSLTMGVVR